jgi:hypothetical protein
MNLKPMLLLTLSATHLCMLLLEYIGKYLSRLRKLDDVITPKEGFET